MTNNDVLRRLRYTFNFNDNKMIALFASADLTVTREQVSAWLKKEDDQNFVSCRDVELATFLNGLINDKRGKKDGPAHAPEKRISNNIILTKLKIALNLKAEDIVELLTSVDFNVTKSELSAFFRKPEHKHFKACGDQLLRNILKAIESTYHVKRPKKFITEKKKDEPAQEVPSKSYKTAKSGASKIYVNPNKKPVEKTENTRKVLKLKPKDIWGE